MSKLDELIAELCPDGVVFKRFDEVCTLHARIGWQRLTRAEYKNSGEYMLITGTDFTPMHEINYKSCVYVSEDRYIQDPKIQLKDGDILITKDGTLGKVAQVNSLPMPATLNGGVFVVRSKDGLLLPRYILHFLLSGHFQKVVNRQKTGSTISHLTQSLFSRLQIPVPPLEVQREIVHILDSFVLLTAELTAELTARKKQYEFYRDELLTFDTDVKIEPLGKLCELQAGKAIKAFLISEEKTPMAPIPCYGANGLRGYVNDYNQEGNKSVIGRQGALCGNVCYATGKYYATEHAVVVTDKGYFNSRYLFHALTHADLNQYKTAGAQPGLSVSRLNEVKIAVPNRNVQDKIANVLDNFESICTDLNIGLPAEIEARQKQYEYYRDLLLTFAETGNTIVTDRQTDRQTVGELL